MQRFTPEVFRRRYAGNFFQITVFPQALIEFEVPGIGRKHDLPVFCQQRQAPALNDSDSEILADLQKLDNSSELLKLLTQEEIARKIVRAVYGLSEGRLVKRFRPMASPEGSCAICRRNITIRLNSSG